MRDVTERRTAADRIDQFFTLSQDLLCIIGADGYFLRVNPAWSDLLGYSTPEILQRPYTELVHPDDLAATRDVAASIAAGAMAVAFDNRYRCQDGTYRWLRWNSTVDAMTGSLYGVARDITDARQLEQDMADARDRAIEASKMKSQFLAIMSHEIRTPMNGVIGLADLLAGTELNATQTRYVAGIRTAGDNLITVINDILDYSKIESGKLILDRTDFNLRTLLDDLMALMSQIARRKNLSLTADIHPDLPAHLNGDPGRIRQILLNLIGNAIKFTEQGTVTVRVHPADDRPAPAEPALSDITFEISDTGIGIEAKALSQVFEPFRQANASTTRTHGGTGLGLSITRQLVEAMAGVITAESHLGSGTTFRVDIPLAVATATTAATAADHHQLRVLIVDENPTSRQNLHDQLQQWGLYSTTVGTVTEAMALLQHETAQSRRFDLAIIDVPAPGDGTPFVEDLAARRDLPALPVILLTSGEQAGTDRHQQGVSAVLTKPVRRSALFEALSAASSNAFAPARRDEPAGPRRGHVLLVEDNDINQLVATDALGQLGYTVDVAADGIEALDKATQRPYQLILMDCQMPHMDGYTATARLRQLPETEHTPIIAMTADAFRENRDRCLAAGMNDYLAKPIKTKDLEKVLTRWTQDAMSIT